MSWRTASSEEKKRELADVERGGDERRLHDYLSNSRMNTSAPLTYEAADYG